MNISTNEFIELSKKEIKKYLDKYTFYILGSTDNIWQVWYAKTIQNHKGIFATPLYLFECTYNGDDKELYVDCYAKVHKEEVCVE